ncbi:MAG: beta-propeller fold lactonase family protein, partial [Alphaproteobacteria bacterium]|nr:beta-propeller fold lactonase family protein [Alphaproteobacteria bacterium]
MIRSARTGRPYPGGYIMDRIGARPALGRAIPRLLRLLASAGLTGALLAASALAAPGAWGQTVRAVDTEFDDGTRLLDGVFSGTPVTISENSFFYANAFSENGINIFSVASDGTLTQSGSVADGGSLRLLGAIASTSVVVNGTTYLMAGGFSDSGISIFSVASDGTLTNVDNVGDDVTLQLGGFYSVDTAVVNGTTYLFAAGFSDNGVSVFSVANDGTLTNVDNVTDSANASYELSGARSVIAVESGGNTFIVVAGSTDAGISVFSVANDGTLTNVDNEADGGALELDGVRTLATAVVGGTPYVFTGAEADAGISVFSIASDGMLTNVANVADDGTFNLASVLSVATIVEGGVTYLAASSIGEDGISVFSVASNGALTNVANISDTAGTALNDPYNVVGAVIDGSSLLFVSGNADDGVSVFKVDATAPRISSIERHRPDGSPALNGGRVTWRVTFDEDVQNVTSDDFGIAGTTGTLSVTTVSASVYDVAVSGGDMAGLNGTITLSVAGGQNIEDLAGNALTNTVPTGANENTFALLSDAEPAGSEFLVNTTTAAAQDDSEVAALTGGGFVVVWQDLSTSGGDTSGYAVRGQRYNADGTTAGSEFLVNTTTTGSQSDPSIAALSDGGFVVVFDDDSGTGGDTSNTAVRGQRFDASGNTVGSEFLVNTTTSNNQLDPDVAGLVGGGFVVAFGDFSRSGGDTSGYAVRAQRYDSDGNAAGSEFLVNTTTSSTQDDVSVAGLTGGGFVIVFDDSSATGGDTSFGAVRGQLYDADGNTVGSEFLVNTTTSNGQLKPDVAALRDGGFIVVFEDSSASSGDTSGIAVRGQRFDAAGSPQGAEFLVNSTTSDNQNVAAVTGLAGGGFVVAYSDASGSAGDTSSIAVRAQRFDDAGVASGSEFLVNTTTASVQRRAGLAGLAAGGFVISFEDNSASSGDTDNYAIRAQRYDIDSTAPLIASIERQTPSSSPTNADSVTWRILFTETVVNVDTTDFSVSGTSGTVTNVTNSSGNFWDVTVSGGDMASLDGTITLSFAGGQDITDSAGNALTNTTPYGIFQNTYVIDNTAPRVTQIERRTDELTRFAPRWTVRFNEDVSNLGIADFTVSGTTGTLSQLILAPSFLDMDVSGGDIANLNGTVTLSFTGGQDITDLAGNALTNLAPTGVNQPSTIIDTIAPTVVVNIVEDDLGTGETSLVTFEFSEGVVEQGQGLSGTGTGGTVSNFTQVDADSWTANFTLADGAAEGRVDIDDTVYWDLAGNLGVPGGDTVQRDVTPPVLMAFARNTPFGETTDADTLVFDITFNENMLNVSVDDFLVTGTTAGGNLEGSGAAYTLTLLGGNLAGFNGTVGLDLAPDHDITDVGGIALGAGEPSRDETYTVLNTGPRIASIERQSPATSPTIADSLTWRVTFENDVTYTPAGAVLTNTDNVTDDATLALDLATWVTTAEVNGTDYVFVIGYNDSGVSVFSAASDGTLTHVETVVDDGTLLLDGASSAETAVVAGTTYLFVTGITDSGVSVFSVANDGTLTNVDNVADDGTLLLDGAYRVHTAVVDSTTYLFVASLFDSGVSVFSVANDGTLANVENVADDATLELWYPRSLDTEVISGTTYLFVAGTTDDGISVFSVANDGTLTNVFNVADGPGMALDGAHDVTAITIDGRTYLYVGVINDDRVQVFEVNAAGQLNLIQSVIDDGSLELEGVIALTPTVINNQTYLIASGARDSGISLFSVANDGTLTSVQNIADDATLQLYGARSGAMAVVGDQTFFIVVAYSDNGVSVFSIAPDGAASSNFAVAGTTATATETRVSSNVIDVTASGGDLAGLDGTVTLSLSGTQDFSDLAGNALFNTTPTGTNNNTFVLDRTGPLVASIERETPATILFQPRWTVRFNENVSNLDASDFTVDGIPGSMMEIDSGANFIEMQSTVAAFNQLSGTATLAFAAGQDITDTLGNALTNLTPTGTNQNTTIIDRTAPTVVVNIVDSALSDADNTSIVTFEFSEPVTSFVISDATAAGGSLSLFNVVDQDSYSATFTADDNSTTQGSVTVGANSYNDAVGNPGSSGTDTVTVDTANPTVAITGPSGPVGGAFTATITYSESVTGLALGEITVGNGAASNLSGSGTTYTATITPDGEGPVTVDVGAGVAIDAAGNLNIAASQFSVTADATAPLVASISLQNPVEQETSAEVLTWEIVFNEFVQNISADDFTITGTTATITGFAQQGDATTYRVTISGGNLATESVSPAISFAGDQDITDLAGNALTNTSSQGTDDNLYNVDNSPPIVTDIFASNNATVGSTLVSWTVSISEDTANLTIDDFTLETSAGVSASDLQISVDNGTNVQVTANLTGSGTAQLKFNAGTDIVDAFGNGNGTNGYAPAYDDDSISVATVDTVPPLVASIERQAPASSPTNASSVTWRILFAETVVNVDVSDFTVSGTTGTVTNVTNPSGNFWDVTVSGGDMGGLDGTITLSFAGGQDITDAEGNALTNTVPYGIFQNTYVLDISAPILTAFARNTPAGEKTNADTLVFDISFSEAVTNVSADDFDITGTTATGVLAGSGSAYTLTLSGGDLASYNGIVGIDLASGQDITDLAGNAQPDAEPATDETYDVRNLAPALASITRSSPAGSPTNADSLVWDLSFSAIDSTFTLPANAFTVSGTTATVTDVTRYSIGLYVTVSGGDLADLDGDVTLALANTDFADDYGNVMDRTIPAGAELTYTLDNAAPTLTSILRQTPSDQATNADSLTWLATFSEAVSADAADFAVYG